MSSHYSLFLKLPQIQAGDRDGFILKNDGENNAAIRTFSM